MKKIVKTACLTGIKKIKLIDLPMPSSKEGKVLVRIESCGCCGSDVHYYRDGRIGYAVCKYPHAIGHEPAGTVEKSFRGSSFKPGDRVAIEPGLHCGKCEFCLMERFNLCVNIKFLGTPPEQGAFQTALLLDEKQLVRIPDSMTYDEAAMLEPLGIAYHSIVNLSKIKPENTVAVFGAGPIGLLTLKTAKWLGCGTAFITDPLEYRLKFAKKHAAADFALNPEKTDVVDFIMDKTSGRGVDIAFDACGAQQAIDHCFASARIGGKAIMIGIPESDSVTYNPHPIRHKELEILNVRRSNRTLEPCLELVGGGYIDVKPFITHKFPMDDIGKALEIAETYKDNVIKIMINP